MTLVEITQTLRDLADKHVEIKGFYTGLAHEVNDSMIQYPALRMTFPYSLIPLEDEDELTITFKLTLLVNALDNVVSPGSSYEVNTNYNAQDDTLNEIDSDIVDETLLREKAIQILAQYMEGLRMLEDELEYFVVSDNWTINSEERANNDYVTGASVNISLTFGNDYKCQAQANVNNTVWKDENGNMLPIDYIIQADCPPLPPIPPQYSMSYDGINESIVCGNRPACDFVDTDPFTIGVWYNLSNTNCGVWNSRALSGSYEGVGLIIQGTQVRFLFRSLNLANYLEVKSVEVLPLNVWSYLQVKYDGSGTAAGVSIWLDDAQLTNNVVSDTLPTTAPVNLPINIGKDVSAFFRGNIGWLRVWNKVLSTSESTAEYNSGVMLTDAQASANIVFENKSGTEALYSGANASQVVGSWGFPDLGNPSDIFVPVSVNMSPTNRTTNIPT
jgi:hypothetical protein